MLHFLILVVTFLLFDDIATAHVPVDFVPGAGLLSFMMINGGQELSTLFQPMMKLQFHL
jgi:hypothetical protein